MLIGGLIFIKDTSKKDRESYRSASTVFGDAKLGDWTKIKKVVTSKNSGMVFGEDYNPRLNASYSHNDKSTWGKGGKSPLITMDTSYEAGHSLIISGSGGGKTAAFVVPTCLAYRHSLVVVDPNGEALKLTMEKRTSMGRNVREVCPGKGIDIMAILSIHFVTGRQYRHLADMMVIREKDSEFSNFYADECITLLGALLEFFTEENKELSTFAGVASVINLSEIEMKTMFSSISVDSKRENIKSIVKGMIDKDSKFFTYFTSTLRQSLNWTVYKEMVSMVSTHDKDAPDPLDPNTDLFITLDEQDIEEFPGLVRLILGAITYDMMKREDRSTEKLMIVDEAKLFGYFPLFEALRDRARKYRLHLMLVYQSIVQIEKAYGRTGPKEWANVAVRSYSAIEDMDEAKALSEMIGSFTVGIQENSQGSSGSPVSVIGQSHNIGLSERTQQAALITPEEIRKLPQDAQILIFRRQSPLICGKAFYFRRPEWLLKTKD
jgi:type IV secretion system protein VirD4